MAYPNVTFREFLDGATLQELEQFAALLQGFLQNEHKSNGSHKSITGNALTLTADTDSGAAGGVSAVDGTFSGDVSIGDALTVTGAFIHDGLLNQDAVKDDPSGINSTATNWGAATLGFEMNIRVTSVAGLGPRLDGLIDPASAGTGAVGTVYRIYNDAGSAFTVKHESSLATAAAYRILCPGGVDTRIRSHGAFWLVRMRRRTAGATSESAGRSRSGQRSSPAIRTITARQVGPTAIARSSMRTRRARLPGSRRHSTAIPNG